MIFKRFILSLCVIAVVAVSVDKPAHAYDYMRDAYPTSISFVIGGISDDIDDPPFPLPGIRWTENVAFDWAIVTQLTTLIEANILSVGANYYIYGDLTSLYVSARLGVAQFKNDLELYGDAGLGFEYSSGLFVLNLEAGPASVAEHMGYHVTLGLGGRF